MLRILLGLALILSTAYAYAGGGAWKMGPWGPYYDENDWPEYTPMYWMQEFINEFSNDNDEIRNWYRMGGANGGWPNNAWGGLPGGNMPLANAPWGSSPWGNPSTGGFPGANPYSAWNNPMTGKPGANPYAMPWGNPMTNPLSNPMSNPLANPMGSPMSGLSLPNGAYDPRWLSQQRNSRNAYSPLNRRYRNPRTSYRGRTYQRRLPSYYSRPYPRYR